MLVAALARRLADIWAKPAGCDIVAQPTAAALPARGGCWMRDQSVGCMLARAAWRVAVESSQPLQYACANQLGHSARIARNRSTGSLIDPVSRRLVVVVQLTGRYCGTVVEFNTTPELCEIVL